MDWEQAAEDMKARVWNGTLTEADIYLARDISENAKEICGAHDWIRALGGWVAELDDFAHEFLQREIEYEDRMEVEGESKGLIRWKHTDDVGWEQEPIKFPYRCGRSHQIAHSRKKEKK